MKRLTSILPAVLLTSLALSLSACSSTSRKQPAESTPVGGGKSGDKSVQLLEDVDEYDVASIADPLEPLNRATFWLNDGIYTYLFRPISKGYQTVVPKPVRNGIHNAFENVKFPVRFVNNALQGNFKRAGQETGRFLVNSTVGVAGLGRPADRIPSLADVPEADTAQTFSKWGIGHGAYLVLPVLGPSSLRDTVGLAGDYALNPVNWVSILYGGYAWTIAIPSTNSVRSLPVQLGAYDTAIKNSLDRYLAARSSYVQYRAEAASK